MAGLFGLVSIAVYVTPPPWPQVKTSLPNRGRGFFWVLGFPAQLSRNQVLGPWSLGTARHSLAGCVSTGFVGFSEHLLSRFLHLVSFFAGLLVGPVFDQLSISSLPKSCPRGWRGASAAAAGDAADHRVRSDWSRGAPSHSPLPLAAAFWPLSRPLPRSSATPLPMTSNNGVTEIATAFVAHHQWRCQ